MWLNRLSLHWTELPKWARLGAPIFAGGLASLGQAPFELPLISVVGFALAFPLLGVAATGREAARLGWLFGLGYFVVTLQWLVSPFLVEPDRHGWMAPFAVVLMAVGLALFWGGAFAFARRIGVGGLVLALPLAELARAYLFTGFPWGMPAYGLVNSLAGQGAALAGSHGLNVLLMALAFAVFVTVSNRGLRRGIGALISSLGILALWPLAVASPEEAQTVGTIRLVQPNAPQHQKWDPDYMSTFFDRALSFTAAEGTPDLIVWPETSVPASLPGGLFLRDQMAAAAGGVPIVFGVNRFDDLLIFNAAVLMEADGTLSQIYDKHHLVPFGEYVPFGEIMARFGINGLAASEGRGFTPGAGATLMNLGELGHALPLICYEAVFPQDVGSAPERPDFLLQITNDAWFGQFSGPHQHLSQSRMRSIEQGLPMVRAANTGISALIDAQGRILKALPLNEAGFIDVDLPAPDQPTLYSRTGDLPVAVLLLLATLALWVKRRRLID